MTNSVRKHKRIIVKNKVMRKRRREIPPVNAGLTREKKRNIV